MGNKKEKKKGLTQKEIETVDKIVGVLNQVDVEARIRIIKAVAIYLFT